MIGINAQIKSQSGGGEGVGFAIPVDAVRRSLRELRAKGRVDYGYLGVERSPLYPSWPTASGGRGHRGAGADVVDGQPGRGGRARGRRRGHHVPGPGRIPVGGDLIVAVDGKKLTREHDLADVISQRGAGEKVELTVLRGGKRRTVSVALGRAARGRGPVGRARPRPRARAGSA